MTGQAMARLSGVTADVGPAPGSAWQPARPGVPRPLEAGWFTLVTLPTSPFWARRYTRTFLDSCRGIGEDTAQTAELLVSELVTNAVRFAGDPARTLAVLRARQRQPDIAVPAAFPRAPAHRGLRHRRHPAGPVPPRRRRRKRPGPDARQRAEQGMVLLPPAGRRQGRLLRPGDHMTRPREVSQLTTAELETARRQLRANLGLITPGSPAHVPILAHMQAIDAELAGRAVASSAARASVTTAGCFPARLLPSARRAGTPVCTSPRPARDLTPNGTRADAAAGTTAAPAGDVRGPSCSRTSGGGSSSHGCGPGTACWPGAPRSSWTASPPPAPAPRPARTWRRGPRS